MRSKSENMDKITVGDKTFRLYIPYEEFSADIDRVAAQLSGDFAAAELPPVFLCTLNGAMMFCSELLKRCTFPLELASIKVSSYIGTQSTGVVEVRQDLTCDVKGRDIIIIEDIVDTGHTINMMKQYLEQKGARSSRICTLFYKPDSFRYKDSIKLDYVAREIRNEFIVGFGLDYNELGRNTRDIYILDD